MRNLFLMLTALLVLAGCQTSEPSITPAILTAQGARLLTGQQITDLVSGRTIYGEFIIDYRRRRAGASWSEYYDPDGTYHYKDSVRPFRGRWTVEGDTICYFEQDAKGCSQVYRIGEMIYLLYVTADRFQGKVIARSTRILPGDPDQLKRIFMP
ncbi:hypothetical protein [Inquilinus sp. Marseille-Q2685]|uniref:hypothetical protein n=1 Tax=Inquilinus sp. Marseille-Q2685 TaxID=2866581 RepID=UPI001CE3CAA0|nr:hypothetical protein [Inquilinus sp. Marseille-Q2685]